MLEGNEGVNGSTACQPRPGRTTKLLQCEVTVPEAVCHSRTVTRVEVLEKCEANESRRYREIWQGGLRRESAGGGYGNSHMEHWRRDDRERDGDVKSR